MPGAFHGSGWLGATSPPLAKLVSRPAASRRSTTVTSWPASRRYHAALTPESPAPITITRIATSLQPRQRPRLRLLVGARDAQHARLVEQPADDLQAGRHAVGEAARHAHRRLARHVERPGERAPVHPGALAGRAQI